MKGKESNMILSDDLTISITVLKDGQICSHPGCAKHVKHPCEGCGRFGAKGEVRLPKYVVNIWTDK